MSNTFFLKRWQLNERKTLPGLLKLALHIGEASAPLPRTPLLVIISFIKLCAALEVGFSVEMLLFPAFGPWSKSLAFFTPAKLTP